MHKSPLETAQHQLLAHWRRSGIRWMPTSNADGVAKATEWMADQSSLAPPPSETAPQPAVQAAKNLSTPPISASSPKPTQPIPSPPSTAPSAIETEKEGMPAGSAPSSPRSKPMVPQMQLGLSESWLTPSKTDEQRRHDFEQIDALVRACRKCTDIVCRRQQTVFGVGPSNARLVMFGEAPGADEDRVGEPFVGAAGQLLNKILIASGLSRDQVYIMNALKCRPPNNRTPVESEIENCRPYFEAQLEVIQPDYIVCWGAVAVRAILKSTESVGRLRGRFHAFRGAKVLVTYHPAYLLRSPDAKRLTWDDMKLLMHELGIPIPDPKRK